MHEVLEFIIEWFQDNADTGTVKVDTDGYATINGTFDLADLAELIVEHL